jgi:hypothetical protein
MLRNKEALKTGQTILRSWGCRDTGPNILQGIPGKGFYDQPDEKSHDRKYSRR